MEGKGKGEKGRIRRKEGRTRIRGEGKKGGGRYKEREVLKEGRKRC